MPRTLLPEPEKEVACLTKQDAVITHFMNNKPIVAPVDLDEPGLVVLDPATANGLFLREIQPLLNKLYTLLGYDQTSSRADVAAHVAADPRHCRAVAA